jgi:hypothetical protein
MEEVIRTKNSDASYRWCNMWGEKLEGLADS